MIFALYLKVRSDRKYESKDPIFYALTANLILCTAYFGTEMALVLLEVNLDQVSFIVNGSEQRSSLISLLFPLVSGRKFSDVDCSKRNARHRRWTISLYRHDVTRNTGEFTSI